MVKGNLDGMMEENILEVINVIKNMDMVNFFGLIINTIKDNGKKENNMGWLCIKDEICLKKDNAISRKEKEQNG